MPARTQADGWTASGLKVAFDPIRDLSFNRLLLQLHPCYSRQRQRRT